MNKEDQSSKELILSTVKIYYNATELHTEHDPNTLHTKLMQSMRKFYQNKK